MLHVRESLEHDPDMCAAFRMSADAIWARVLASADVIVANSGFTAGNKTGNEKRFYEVMIPIADREFTAHLEKLKKE